MHRKTKALKEDYELIVIGGGASGLYLALDGVSRGYKTLLLEKYDFAKGTSSRSTKLLHGGVRYLAQGNLSLVHEALHERDLLLFNGANCAKKLEFIIPVEDHFSSFYYFFGLKLYDLLAGALKVGKSSRLDKTKASSKLKGLKDESFSMGLSYYDACFDDARMALSIAKAAYKMGASIINYAEVVDLLKVDQKVKGVKVLDQIENKEYEIKGSCIVNATGVFSSDILEMDHSPSNVSPSQGVHIVLDREFFPNDNALIIPKTSDGRVLFAIPWHGKVLVGTTDTPLKEVSFEPRALDQEIDFIIDTASRYLEKTPKRSDIRSVFAGLRPLIGSANKESKELSRSHKIEISKSNLITLNGGKWTTSRLMAEQTLDLAIENKFLEQRSCKTKEIKLDDVVFEYDQRLSVYGSDAKNIQELEKGELSKKIHKDYEYTYAQVFWALKHEMAHKLEDVLARRIRLLFIDSKACEDIASEVAEFMADHLNWDDQKKDQEINEFLKLVKNYQI